jgi:hypothetical protein
MRKNRGNCVEHVLHEGPNEGILQAVTMSENSERNWDVVPGKTAKRRTES